MDLLNTEDAAKILGVNVSTIKRWSAEGKLNCIKSPGGHRKFEMYHLTEFIERFQKQGKRVNAFTIKTNEDIKISEWILKKDYLHLNTIIQKYALRCNRSRMLDILKAALFIKIPLFDIYDHIITPVLVSIGELWAEKQISVTEEHFASQAVKDSVIRLQSLIAMPEKKTGSVMCMNLPNEMHDIALKMADHILEYKGYKVLYSGQLTPRIQLDSILEDYAPKRLYLSSTYIENRSVIQNEFDEICEIAAKFSVPVYVGGNGFNLLNYNREPVVCRLFTFRDVFEK
jgi:excisionase family DNA binding protein